MRHGTIGADCTVGPRSGPDCPDQAPIAPSGPDRAPIAPSGPDRAPIAPSGPDQLYQAGLAKSFVFDTVAIRMLRKTGVEL